MDSLLSHPTGNSLLSHRRWEFTRPTGAEVRSGLRAMRTLLEAKGSASGEEGAFLEAVQGVWGTSHDLATLETISPEELAREIPAGPLATQLVAGLATLALIDGKAEPAEIECIRAFARALGVADDATKTLTQLAEGQLLRMRFDLIRRSWVAKKLGEIREERGIWSTLEVALQIAGKLADPELEARCRALEHAAPGTLGRAYYDYILKNGFDFPGTKGAPPEIMMAHDVAHIFSGYDTDPEGELQVLGFVIGFAHQQPLDHLLSGLMQFHVGVQITPGAKPTRGRFQLEPFLRALQRGAAMNTNLNEGWDPWAVIDVPVEALRVRYNVPPP